MVGTEKQIAFAEALRANYIKDAESGLMTEETARGLEESGFKSLVDAEKVDRAAIRALKSIEDAATIITLLKDGYARRVVEAVHDFGCEDGDYKAAAERYVKVSRNAPQAFCKEVVKYL